MWRFLHIAIDTMIAWLAISVFFYRWCSCCHCGASVDGYHPRSDVGRPDRIPVRHCSITSASKQTAKKLISHIYAKMAPYIFMLLILCRNIPLYMLRVTCYFCRVISFRENETACTGQELFFRGWVGGLTCIKYFHCKTYTRVVPTKFCHFKPHTFGNRGGFRPPAHPPPLALRLNRTGSDDLMRLGMTYMNLNMCQRLILQHMTYVHERNKHAHQHACIQKRSSLCLLIWIF